MLRDKLSGFVLKYSQIVMVDKLIEFIKPSTQTWSQFVTHHWPRKSSRWCRIYEIFLDLDPVTHSLVLKSLWVFLKQDFLILGSEILIKLGISVNVSVQHIFEFTWKLMRYKKWNPFVRLIEETDNIEELRKKESFWQHELDTF